MDVRSTNRDIILGSTLTSKPELAARASVSGGWPCSTVRSALSGVNPMTSFASGSASSFSSARIADCVAGKCSFVQYRTALRIPRIDLPPDLRQVSQSRDEVLEVKIDVEKRGDLIGVGARLKEFMGNLEVSCVPCRHQERRSLAPDHIDVLLANQVAHCFEGGRFGKPGCCSEPKIRHACRVRCRGLKRVQQGSRGLESTKRGKFEGGHVKVC